MSTAALCEAICAWICIYMCGDQGQSMNNGVADRMHHVLYNSYKQKHTKVHKYLYTQMSEWIEKDAQTLIDMSVQLHYLSVLVDAIIQENLDRNYSHLAKTFFCVTMGQTLHLQLDWCAGGVYCMSARRYF